MPRRWLRIAAFVLFLAALGAMTTTGVAWGIALSRTTRFTAREPTSTKAAPTNGASKDTEPNLTARDGILFGNTIEYPGITELHSMRIESWRRRDNLIQFETNIGWRTGMNLARAVEDVPDGRHIPQRPASIFTEFRFGWPARSFWYLGQVEGFADVIRDSRCEGLWFPLNSKSGKSEFKSSIGIQPGASVSERWLPIYILPLGFALDSLFYAAAWSVPLFGIRMGRRTLRRRRGLCARCAYDLKGLTLGSPCPECGHASAQAKASPTT